MSEPKHTPGPWSIERHPAKGLFWIEDEVGESICDLYHREDTAFFLRKNSEANAKRIVKAVNCHDELLEALEELLRVYGGGPREDYQCMKDARAAIAKAKGES